MKNFGEELAYWYLRLNGFFLIDNLALHRASLVQPDLNNVRDADADIIGIRNPFTVEEIGMANAEDICPKLCEFSDDRILTKTVVVISEVKSGDSEPGEILLNREARLRYVVKRTGLFEEDRIAEVTSHLLTNKSYQNEPDTITILKIIFSQTDLGPENFHYLSLSYIEQNIRGKFSKYITNKNPAKLFFPSTLMQYLIWKVKEENSSKKQEDVREKVAIKHEETN